MLHGIFEKTRQELLLDLKKHGQLSVSGMRGNATCHCGVADGMNSAQETFPGGSKMFDRFTETLRLEVAGVQERFPLEICRKSSRFADLEIQQYWIDRGAVYGRRDQPTHRSIVEFFWAVCRQQGAATGRSAGKVHPGPTTAGNTYLWGPSSRRRRSAVSSRQCVDHSGQWVRQIASGLRGVPVVVYSDVGRAQHVFSNLRAQIAWRLRRTTCCGQRQMAHECNALNRMGRSYVSS